jgi:3-hydroxyacyl-[acyl-carrier-protein] dehydratase
MNRLRDGISAAAKGPVREKEPGVFAKSYCFPRDFVGFSGHFPGYPVLPAFIQMLTVLISAEEVKGCPLAVISVEKAKFQKEIYPDVTVEVECRDVVVRGKTGLKATLATGDGIAASLVLTFEEAG